MFQVFLFLLKVDMAIQITPDTTPPPTDQTDTSNDTGTQCDLDVTVEQSGGYRKKMRNDAYIVTAVDSRPSMGPGRPPSAMQYVMQGNANGAINTLSNEMRDNLL